MVAVALGTEFVVNTVLTGNQYRPAIVALATGGFAISWQDDSGTGSPDVSDDVRFAIYDGSGTRLNPGVDLQANTTNVGAQFESSIAAGDSGTFVIAWTDASETGDDGNNRAVRMQIVNSTGGTIGPEVLVNTTYPLSQDEPSITVLNNGNIVVTWTSEDLNASGTTNVIRRVFNSSGGSVTGEQVVNTQTVGDQERSTVHALSTGGFAVVWEDRENVAPPGFFQFRTFIRFYNENGTALALPGILNTTTAMDPQQAGFAELSTGNIVVTWTETDPDLPSGDGSGHSIRARILNPGSGIFGPVITVNTTTSNDQTDAQVAALDNGQFVVVWSDRNTSGDDTSFGAVRLQVFDAAGNKVGAELRVNELTLFEQANPVITVLPDFRFVVTWEDRSQLVGDLDGYSIRSRIFDARIAGINLQGSTQADEYVGSTFADTISGLAGADTLLGNNGSDYLIGGLSLDLLEGGNDNDTLDGGQDRDTLIGGAGNDVLLGGAGNDSLNGSTGTGDMAAYWDSPTGLTVSLSDPTQNTGIAIGDTYFGIENLAGTNFGDSLVGDSGANYILGFGDIDVLSGLAGNDTLDGGAGNDTILGGTGADMLIGGAGIDVIGYGDSTVGLRVDLQTPASNTGIALGDTFSGIENLGGSSFNDTLNGDAAGNRIFGFGGADVIESRGGNDTLEGGEGNDTLGGGLGADSVIGGNGRDLAYFWDSTAGGVTARLDIVGGNTGFATGDVFSGIEDLAGTSFVDVLVGNASGNVLLGLAGNDTLFGQGGNDTLQGGAGNDMLYGSAGNDFLAGENGADSFVFEGALGATNVDGVIGFVSADDQILLENAVFTTLAGGALSAGQLALGASATLATHRIIYNQATGLMYYDADGVGGAAQTLFANFGAGAFIVLADFQVI